MRGDNLHVAEGDFQRNYGKYFGGSRQSMRDAFPSRSAPLMKIRLARLAFDFPSRME